MMRIPNRVLLTLATIPIALTACSSGGSEAGTSAGSSDSVASATGSVNTELTVAPLGGECAADKLDVMTPGTLTFGTADPAEAPWFLNNNPSTGEGFESGLAYAVAQKLGFSMKQVTWTKVDPKAAVAAGKKPFDIDINQFLISPQLEKTVDVSTGYLVNSPTLVALEGGLAQGATSIADLGLVRMGVIAGTPAVKTLNTVVKPTTKPVVFKNKAEAVAGLQGNKVDAVVVDLLTASTMVSVDMTTGVVVGKLPDPDGSAKNFGMVLSKGSKLTPCVNKAIDALAADQTLQSLDLTWLGIVPTLQ